MEKDQLSRKLAVILHADVVDSTGLVRQNETLAHERFQDTFRRFSETISNYNGVTHEIRGDALVAEFPRASDAVSASLEFQASNATHIEQLSDDIQPVLRIGIAMGEVVIADNTVTGEGVVLAQRLEQLAEAGKVCIQGAAHETVPKRLPFDYLSLGQQQVKGFQDSVQAYVVSLKPGESIPAPDSAVGITSKMQSRSQFSSLVIGSVSLLLLIVCTLAWWQPWVEREEAASIERMSFPLPDKPSIAVLPFTNMSDDSEQEYFADGMTEDLITDLSKISGLFVIARNSTFSYKGQAVKIRQVAEDLGVRYVMEGSVRRVGDQVRINAQLIDATTGGHLWAERYDGSLADIFALQDQVTTKIVNAMSVTLTPREIEELRSFGTSNAIAHDAFLQGLSFYLRNTPEDNAKAETHFKRAVEIDPNYKRAYAALANVYFRGVEPDYANALDRYWSRAILLALKNLAIVGNANFTDVHIVRSRMAIWKHQVDIALSEAERALELSVNNVDALKAKANALIYLGQYAEGRKVSNLVMRLDPSVPADPLYLIGLSHFGEGDYERAIEFLERAQVHNPETSYFALPLSASYGKLGMKEEATQSFKKYVSSWYMATPALKHIVYGLPFQDVEVINHLAEGLEVAGVRPYEKPRYLRLTGELRLSGQEIKALLFGNKIEGTDLNMGGQWSQMRSIDGTVFHSGTAIHTGSFKYEQGKSWIEGDRLCDKWSEWSGEEVEISICSLVFRDINKCWITDEGFHRCGQVPPPEYIDVSQDYFYMVTDFSAGRFRVGNK